MKEERTKKIKRNFIIFGVIILIVILLGVIFEKQLKESLSRAYTKAKLSAIEYDIKTWKLSGADKNEGPITMESTISNLGGYASTTYYTLINTQKLKKYEIEYYNIYNNREEDDRVTITEKSITQEESNEYAKKYTKSDTMLKASELIKLNY